MMELQRDKEKVKIAILKTNLALLKEELKVVRKDTRLVSSKEVRELEEHQAIRRKIVDLLREGKREQAISIALRSFETK